MAQSLASEVLTRIKWTYTNSLDLSTPAEVMSDTCTQTFTDGTGSGKAQVAWSDQRTITTASDETLDLKAVTTAFGTAAFTKIKALRIEVVTATTGYTLKMTAGASNGLSAFFSDASDEIVIQAGGGLTLEAPVDGYTVDDTHKTLKMSNPAGGSVVYNIFVIGEGAIA